MRMRLECPMPRLDFDMITLGHGSGGILTHQLLESGVFDLLKNDWLSEQHDGAVFEIVGKQAFSTDSYVISPILFPGGNIGELAINGTVNDLAMCGAIPQFLSLGFILEEGLLMTEFWEILVSIKWAAEKAGVQIVTGDTKVVEKGKGDRVFINTSGVGKVHPQADIRAANVRPSDKIIVNSAIGTHGVAILSVRQGLDFETDIVSDTAPLNHIVERLLNRFGKQIHLLRDPTRGGVATVLNEIARQIRLGIQLQQPAIPVLDEVASACELLGLDPLYVANEGVFLAFVAPEVADEVVAQLRQEPNGQRAAIIGEVTETHPKQVVLDSRIGGKRVVNMLVGEQLPRIC